MVHPPESDVIGPTAYNPAITHRIRLASGAPSKPRVLPVSPQAASHASCRGPAAPEQATRICEMEPLPFIADDLFINCDDGRAPAGLAVLAKLSEMTQVIFLAYHAHLVPLAQAVFGRGLKCLGL